MQRFRSLIRRVRLLETRLVDLPVPRLVLLCLVVVLVCRVVDLLRWVDHLQWVKDDLLWADHLQWDQVQVVK
tara:strand:+ start:4146 stop:4361 length:216 start_codon:yes stop_codon:yes gene_type:complete